MPTQNRKVYAFILSFIVTLIAGTAAAAPDAAPPKLSLKFQTGKVTLANGVANLNLPENYGFLDEKQARRVLTDVWGNPDTEAAVLGMITPTNIPLTDQRSWAVLLYYSEDGHIADDDAKGIDYTQLLKEMQQGVAEGNKFRQEAGYPPITLVGWAEPPHYDQSSHKLYWAKQLRFGGETEETLNYSIRALGRQGVLELNIVASMTQLQEINKHVPQILSMVDFNEGQRYADYKPGTDKLAVYGIGALIAGKVAAKAGFLKVIIAAIIAMKKFVIIALIALVAVLRKLFGRSGEAVPSPAAAPETSATMHNPEA